MKCDAVIVGLALCIAGVAYYSGCQNEDRLRALRAENDSLQGSITVLNEDIQRHRQTDQLERAAHEAQIIRLTRSYRSTMADTDTLLDTLFLADSTQIGYIRTQIENERREAQTLIDTLTAQRDWAYTRIAFWRDTALVQRSAQLDASQALLNRALAAKRPSHLVRGMLIGGAVVGVVSLLR